MAETEFRAVMVEAWDLALPGTLTNLGDGGSDQNFRLDGNGYRLSIIAGSAGGGGNSGGNSAGLVDPNGVDLNANNILAAINYWI